MPRDPYKADDEASAPQTSHLLRLALSSPNSHSGFPSRELGENLLRRRHVAEATRITTRRSKGRRIHTNCIAVRQGCSVWLMREPNVAELEGQMMGVGGS